MTDSDRTRYNAAVCQAFDVPVHLVTGTPRPRFFRLRWAFRRFTWFVG